LIPFRDGRVPPVTCSFIPPQIVVTVCRRTFSFFCFFCRGSDFCVTPTPERDRGGLPPDLLFPQITGQGPSQNLPLCPVSPFFRPPFPINILLCFFLPSTKFQVYFSRFSDPLAATFRLFVCALTVFFLSLQVDFFFSFSFFGRFPIYDFSILFIFRDLPLSKNPNPSRHRRFRVQGPGETFVFSATDLGFTNPVRAFFFP